MKYLKRYESSKWHITVRDLMGDDDESEISSEEEAISERREKYGEIWKKIFSPYGKVSTWETDEGIAISVTILVDFDKSGVDLLYDLVNKTTNFCDFIKEIDCDIDIDHSYEISVYLSDEQLEKQKNLIEANKMNLL